MPFQYTRAPRAYRDTGLSDIGATVGQAVQGAAGAITSEMEAEEKARAEAALREAMRIEAMRKEAIEKERFDRTMGIQERGVRRLEDKDAMEMGAKNLETLRTQEQNQNYLNALTEMSNVDPQLQDKAEMLRNAFGVAASNKLTPEQTDMLAKRIQGEDTSLMRDALRFDRSMEKQEDQQAWAGRQKDLDRQLRRELDKDRVAKGEKIYITNDEDAKYWEGVLAGWQEQEARETPRDKEQNIKGSTRSLGKKIADLQEALANYRR